MSSLIRPRPAPAFTAEVGPRGDSLSPAARALAGDPEAVALARRLARRMARARGGDPDLLESGAMWGLCKAAAAFDRSYGFPFLAFAEPRIRYAMLDDAREDRPGRRGMGRPKVVSIERADPRPGRSGDAGPISEGLAAEDEHPLDGLEYIDWVEDLAGPLPPAPAAVLRMLYREAAWPEKQAVARTLGLSRSRVNQLHQEAIGAIRDRFLAEADPDDPRVAGLVAFRARLDAREPGMPWRPRYQGVRRRETGVYQVYVRWAGRDLYVGSTADEEEAARMHDAKARELLGDRATLNFPDVAIRVFDDGSPPRA